MPSNKDMINPEHYKESDIEVIDVIEAANLNYNLGNAVKYLLRAHLKGDYVENVKKAIWYIDRHTKTTDIKQMSVYEALEGRNISDRVRGVVENLLFYTGFRKDRLNTAKLIELLEADAIDHRL